MSSSQRAFCKKKEAKEALKKWKRDSRKVEDAKLDECYVQTVAHFQIKLRTWIHPITLGSCTTSHKRSAYRNNRIERVHSTARMVYKRVLWTYFESIEKNKTILNQRKSVSQIRLARFPLLFWCSEWLNDFQTFSKWTDGSDDLSVFRCF